MGSRFLVTGVQLSFIKELINHKPSDAQSELTTIIDKQCVGFSATSIEDDVKLLIKEIKIWNKT